MFCSECGKQVADDAKFCGECGTVQSNVEQTPKIKVEEVTTRNKLQASVTSPSSGNSNVTGYIVGAIMLVGLGYFTVSHFAADKMETTEIAQSNQVESEEARLLRESKESQERARVDIAREKAEAEKTERAKASNEELQQNKIRYTAIFACVDQYNAGRNYSLGDMLISELSKPNGVYAAYMNTSAISEICSSLGTSFNNLELLHQKGQLISSENGRELYLVDLSPNTTVGVIGR